MNPKRISQREKAITAYFATAEDKEQFEMMAKEMGVSASKLATMIMRESMVKGFTVKLPARRKAKTAVRSKRPRTRRPGAK